MSDESVKNNKNKKSLVPKFGPLHGLKVIDTCRYGACHLGATLLAEFGAEVIHIDAPPFTSPTTDSYRFSEPLMPPYSENQVSAHGVQNGRDKLALGLNFLNSQDGKEIFEGLIKWADIFIESSRPGTLDRHGLSDSVLKKLNKKLSVIHLSGFGQTGPKRNDPSHDLDIQAYTGFASLIGYDEEPLRVPWVIADYITSIWIAFSSVLAYMTSRSSDQGDIVDVAQYEMLVRILDPYYSFLATYPQEEEPKRHGNDHPDLFPYRFYRCKDGWISVSAPYPATWVRMRKILDLPPSYDDIKFRETKREEIEEAIKNWIIIRTVSEAEEILGKAGVPTSRVNNIRDFLNDPHVKSRNLITSWKDENIGEVRGIGVVPKFALNPGKIWRGFPKMGQDTDSILHEILGLSDEKIKALREGGIIA
jgi:crotonobetainyl-CoA:carnitine CoA-transferase CaiB-like acyl-CoA transferase